MTNNDEKIDIGLKAITAAIQSHGKKVDSEFEKFNMSMEARLDLINERITAINEFLLVKEKPEPTATNHRGNSTVGPGIIAKPEEPKPEKDAVKGTRIEYKFEEYVNREGECKSYVIYHPDSEQMVKYIAKSLIFEGGPDEDGNLYVCLLYTSPSPRDRS